MSAVNTNSKELKVTPEKRMIVSLHAGKRMIKRMRTSKGKLVKIAKKAWISPDALPRMDKTFNQTNYFDGRVGRSFSGFTFVFKEREEAITVITVINPKEPFGVRVVNPGNPANWLR